MIKVNNNYGIKDISDYQPSTRCYKPQRIYNPYIGDVLYTDCRKCPACLHKYSVELTTRVAEECKQHLYSLFFTLTYDNVHLPVFYKVCPNVWKLNRDYSRDVKGLYYFGKPTDYHYPQKMSTECFAVVCKEDIQLWLKRLRRRIDYTFKNLTSDEKKIRYFICSEYGPKTKRPHYHGILWFDSSKLLGEILRLIRETWQMCDSSRIDAQLVNGSAPQYVAKYLNGFASLDEVLRTKFTKPFHLASKNPIIGSFKSDAKEVFDILVNRTLERVRFQDGKVESASYDVVSVSYLSRHFPTPQGFGLSDDEYKYLLYDKYAKGNYLKEYDHDLKRYKECQLRGYDYLNVPLSFKYQDYRFFKRVREISSRPITTYKRDKFGNIIGLQVLSLSPREVIHLYTLLYSALSLYNMNRMYRDMEVLSTSRDNSKLHQLQFYPYVFRELPLICDFWDFTWKKFKGNEPLGDVFEKFGLSYSDIYDKNNYLRSDFIEKMNNNELDKRYRSEMMRKIYENDRKKKFNEIYNGFNQP